jgi:hypothetical protein
MAKAKEDRVTATPHLPDKHCQCPFGQAASNGAPLTGGKWPSSSIRSRREWLAPRRTVRRRQHVPRRPFSPEPVEECKVVELNSRLRQTGLEEEHIPASLLLIAVGDEGRWQSLSIGDCQPDKFADAGRIKACRGVGCTCSEGWAGFFVSPIFIHRR